MPFIKSLYKQHYAHFVKNDDFFLFSYLASIVKSVIKVKDVKYINTIEKLD